MIANADILWGAFNGVMFVAVTAVGYMWKRLESRVVALETESVKHKDVGVLREDIRTLSSKFDGFAERAEERHARVLELFLKQMNVS